eukprot:COSAG05_NODE_300_length_11883_cov_12.913357_11_plen_366_part_00
MRRWWSRVDGDLSSCDPLSAFSELARSERRRKNTVSTLAIDYGDMGRFGLFIAMLCTAAGAVVGTTGGAFEGTAGTGLLLSHRVLHRGGPNRTVRDSEILRTRLEFALAARHDGSQATDVELQVSLAGGDDESAAPPSYAGLLAVGALGNTGGPRPTVTWPEPSRLRVPKSQQKCDQASTRPRGSRPGVAVADTPGDGCRDSVVHRGHGRGVGGNDGMSRSVSISAPTVALPAHADQATEEAMRQRRARIRQRTQRNQQQQEEEEEEDPQPRTDVATRPPPLAAVMRAQVSVALWLKRWRRSLDCMCTRYSYVIGQWQGCNSPTLRMRADVSYTLGNATLFQRHGAPPPHPTTPSALTVYMYLTR